MAKNLIGWMVFQILVGIWLLISPFVLGFSGARSADVNSIIFGIVVILIALGMSFFSERVCGVEHPTKSAS